ncbi:MAG: glycosyltransferase family 4 protein [Cyanobacteria bacterium P01_E01_bin.35]
MKILISAYACKPNFGSEEGRGWNLSYHLTQMGHQVWVLTLADNQAAIEQELALQPMPNLNFIYISIPEWIKRYVRIPLGDFSWQSDYLGWQQRAYKIARQLDLEHEFDIVHHITWGSITAGSWLWRLDKTFIFGPVGGGQVAPPAFKKYFQDQWQKEGLRSFLFKKLAKFNFFSRQTISQADLVLATNRETYDLAQQLSARRVEMFLTCGLPEDYFSQAIPTKSTSKELRLLWVGRFSMRKGLRLTLESLSKVNNLIPVKMTIVGVSAANDYLAKWIKEFGLEKRVECKGSIPWRAVKNEYLNNDAFFFTSLRDSSALQLLEAMAQSVPIITLDLHGARDIVPDRAGIKVPVTNPTETVAALAQAVEYMYNHPQKRVEMGTVGYEFAKTQTWSRKALTVSDYYRKLKLLEA